MNEFKDKEFSLGKSHTEGSYRLFFRKCGSCGQYKVVFTQKCLGSTNGGPEGIRTQWSTPQLLIGVKSDTMHLCDSCGHIADRVEYFFALEKKITLAETKLDEFRVLLEGR